MTATVTIIHNHGAVTPDRRERQDHSNDNGDPCGVFWDFCSNCIARVEYSYETDRTELEQIYRDNNAVDGTEQNVIHERRSLSVGDVVVVGDEAHKVARMGFEPVDPAVVARALKNNPADGFEIF